MSNRGRSNESTYSASTELVLSSAAGTLRIKGVLFRLCKMRLADLKNTMELYRLGKVIYLHKSIGPDQIPYGEQFDQDLCCFGR